MNVGSLFAGIGGFDLGLERAGMRVAWQVELDPCCRAVLARHFPEARRYEDVCEVGAKSLAPVDLICGGFPCQDLSPAGKGAGLAGARSGLWAEFARIVRELRPRYVVVENVPALLTGKASAGTERRSAEFSETWPKQGMTRSGRACRLESSGHRTCESASGSWPTPHGMPKRGQRRRPGPSGNELGRAVLRAERESFPTPTETDARKGYASPPGPENRRGRQTLSGAVQSRLWPTPKASPSGPDFARAGRPGSGGDDLPTAVAREEFWPTPNAADGKGGRISPDETILSGRRPSGAKAQRTLREAVRKADLAGDSPPRRAGALNPTWVEWLMGFPLGWTALPPSATPCSRRSRSGSDGASSNTSARPSRVRGRG